MKKAPKLKAQLRAKLENIKAKGLNNGICDADMCKLIYDRLGLSDTRDDADSRDGNEKSEVDKTAAPVVSSCQQWLIYILVPCVSALLMWWVSAGYSVSEMWDDVRYSRCLIERNAFVQEMTRPIVNCSMCEGVTEVREVEDISQLDFLMNHAYTGKPLLVKGATKHWSALKTFNYSFFKHIYTTTENAFDTADSECQYFSYKSNLMTLKQVFEMSDARAEFREGETPWYVGWSNCDPTISSKLREHYERPYFLPNQTEASVLDWIFMGGFGPGAMIHLDYVQRPSWQAQISGTKRWTLIPPPECEHLCNTLHVRVGKGDIVCINTNEWYHDTYIEEGEISITIGSEYD